MMAIAYYVSAHGYGHGVRSCDIIGAITRLFPDVSITVVSDLPRELFESRLGRGVVAHRAGSFDVGMVQLDSIRVDVPGTLARVEALYARRDELLAREAAWLRRERIRLVAADIPAMPLEAAARVGIPRVAIGNFSWDWIYAAFVERDTRWGSLARAFEQGYAAADCLLRLPFAAEMRAFRSVEDLPLVASPGRSRRADLAALARCREDTKWVLLSFTTLEWTDAVLDAVERLHDYEFFTVLPLCFKRANIHAIDRERISFADVLASVDGVVSKPGYGIVSDCVVNRKPLLYAERADFVEYEVLVAAIARYVKHAHIPSERLYRGNLGPHLDGLWGQPEPAFALEAGGADIAARRLVALMTQPGEAAPFGDA